MRAHIGILVGMSLFALAASGAPRVDDPYLWLEDVHGAKPLAWVKEQNAKSLAVLKADPDYQKDYDNILAVLDAVAGSGRSTGRAVLVGQSIGAAAALTWLTAAVRVWASVRAPVLPARR